MKYFLLLIFLISDILSENLFAENKDQIIKNLLNDNRPVSFVSWQLDPYFKNIELEFKTHIQNPIKCNNSVYIFINGTGRLYKVIDSNNGINYVRYDSTTNFGYNLGAFAFSYNNHIYNLGGYGFWRINGQLRIFDEKAKEWDIVKLNKEIPILIGKTEGLLWYDMENKKIFTAYYLERNEAIKSSTLEDTHFIYDVMVLDLRKNEWTKLGSLSNYLKDKFSQVNPVTMSPWGQIITIGDSFTLLDFKNNKILTLDLRKDYYQSLSRSHFSSSFYFKDSILFFSNYSNNSLDSVKIKYDDFYPTDEKLYITGNESIISYSKLSILYFSIFMVGSLITIYFFKFSRNKTQKSVSSTSHELLNSSHRTLHTVFEELENQLLVLLIQNTISGKTTSIEEINTILGLDKRSTEIQKKQRSDVIISINSKFSSIDKSKIPIIQKKRTEFDKRSFEYFVDQTRVGEIKELLKKQ